MLLQFERISPALANFSFGLNTSLMKTDVKVNFGNTSLENNPSRKLQGASEWIINSDLKYDFEFNEVMKNSISLVYGVFRQESSLWVLLEWTTSTNNHFIN